MGFVGYQYDQYGLAGDHVSGGITWGRLYGLFADPNYGCAVCLIMCICVAFLFAKKQVKNPAVKVVFVAFCVMGVFYAALSGSRTGLVCIVATVFVYVFLMILAAFWHKKMAAAGKFLVSLVAAFCTSAFCVVLVFGASVIYEAAMPNIAPASGGTISTPWHAFSESFAKQVVCATGAADSSTVQNSLSEKLDAYTTQSAAQSEEQTSTNTQAANSSTDTNAKVGTSSTVENTQENDTLADQSAETQAHVGMLGRDDYTDPTNGRSSLWRGALQIFAANPVFGVGYRNLISYAQAEMPENYIATSQNASVHNVFLEVAASQGVVGLLIFVAILGAFAINIICALLRAARDTKAEE